jgi:hypothetical protein
MLKTKNEAIAIAKQHGVSDQVVIFGYRSNGSQRGQYDDTLAIMTPDIYKEYKGNTLPSKKAPGIAVLQPGVWAYKRGLHGIHHLDGSPGDQALLKKLYDTGKDLPPIPGRILPYYAFRQAGPVTVLRDGHKSPETVTDPVSWPWIDIHHGGYNLTSSEGCQTIDPDGWQDFRQLGFGSMSKYSQMQIKYILIQL